jgi:hypothetical protein
MNPGTVAILLSRQAIRPCGNTPWVKQTVRAVEYARRNGYRVCSSTGMQTWELITALASTEKVPLKLFVQAEGEQAATRKELSDQFSFDPGLVDFVFMENSDKGDKEARLSVRDSRIVEESDVLVPISISEGGNIIRLLEEARSGGKRVIEDFRIRYETREEPIAYHFDSEGLCTEIRGITNEYITHWTRVSNGAWPGEMLSDYYADIARSDHYPRTALDTLIRIISTRRIIASPRHMPGNIPTVSLTELPPIEVLPLMRWRSRYMQMSFEPYGVGIRRERALQFGVVPVRYYDRKNDSGYSNSPEWLRQSIGEKSDWRQEKEYRCLGDLRLDEIPDKDMIVYCRVRDEAAELTRRFGLLAAPFFE